MDISNEKFLSKFLSTNKSKNSLNIENNNKNNLNKSIGNSIQNNRFNLSNKKVPMKIVPLASLTQYHFYSNSNSIVKPFFYNSNTNFYEKNMIQKDYITLDNICSSNRALYRKGNKILGKSIEKNTNSNNLLIYMPKNTRKTKSTIQKYKFEPKIKGHKVYEKVLSRAQISSDNLTSFTTIPTSENSKNTKNNKQQNYKEKFNCNNLIYRVNEKDINYFKLDDISRNFLIERIKILKEGNFNK